MSKDLHMKMEDNLAGAVGQWALDHHVSFSAAIHVLLSTALFGKDSDGELEEIQR